MLLKNPTKTPVTCEPLGFTVAPGETVTVADGYCIPRPSVPGTAPQEAAIRLLCPQLIPADDKLLDAWLSNTISLRLKPGPGPSAAALESQGMSPGLAALAAAGLAAEVPKGPSKGPSPAALPPKK